MHVGDFQGYLLFRGFNSYRTFIYFTHANEINIVPVFSSLCRLESIKKEPLQNKDSLLVTLEGPIYKRIVGEIVRWNESMENVKPAISLF